jgi:hypothetical protein
MKIFMVLMIWFFGIGALAIGFMALSAARNGPPELMPAINFAGLAFISVSGIAIFTGSTFVYAFRRIQELEKKVQEMEAAAKRQEMMVS